MRYQVGDVVMYNYVNDIPYFGIVVVANSGDSYFWARWWGSKSRVWDTEVSKVDHNDRYTHLLGVLPEWAETDEHYGSQLPLTRRVASG